MATTQSDIRSSVTAGVKDGAAGVVDTVKAQAAAAGESLAAAAGSALDTASAQGKQAGRRAQKRAKELADEAAERARKQARTARKRADKAATRATKKARKRAAGLSVAVQEKAGRHPRRQRRLVVFGGLALAGVTVAAVLRRRNAQDDTLPVSPTADTGSGLPGDPGQRG